MCITFQGARDIAEFISFVMLPVLAYFAWRMLAQIRIGAQQVEAAATQIKTAREIAQTQASREALRIAAEQTRVFAEDIIPLMTEFHQLKEAGSYPIFSRAKVNENWPEVQCHTDDLPGLLKEVYSNNALVIRLLNRMESLAMYFTCGVADAEKGYRPLCASFCSNAKTFLPYLIIANERERQFTYTLMLYGAWGVRDHVERTQMDLSKKKEHLSKIQIPKLPTFGTGQTQ